MWRAQHHDATTIEAAGIVAGTKESIANELAARDPSIKAWLFNALGIEVPQTEAPSPTFRPTPSTEATTPPSPSAKSPSRPEASKAAPPRKAAAAKYKEGQTATGPNGHQIVFQSGQWVDKSKLPAVGPGPPAAVVACFPGEAPQPATALAASTARTVAATARE